MIFTERVPLVVVVQYPEKVNYCHSRTSIRVLVSPVENLAKSSPHSWSCSEEVHAFCCHTKFTMQRRLSQAGSLLLYGNVRCRFPQCCHPVTWVVCSAISTFFSSTTSDFHDISSSTTSSLHNTSVKFLSLVTTSAWLQLLSWQTVE